MREISPLGQQKCRQLGACNNTCMVVAYSACNPFSCIISRCTRFVSCSHALDKGICRLRKKAIACIVLGAQHFDTTAALSLHYSPTSPLAEAAVPAREGANTTVSKPWKLDIVVNPRICIQKIEYTHSCHSWFRMLSSRSGIG